MTPEETKCIGRMLSEFSKLEQRLSELEENFNNHFEDSNAHKS